MALTSTFPTDYIQTKSGLFVAAGVEEVDDSYTYSDGAEIEDSIYSILKQASDVSSLSAELQGKIVDWPTNYYLSPRRANLLRPLEPLLQGRVLEVGAGCGAVTRYLGEVATEVVAVEGSAARALAAVERVRDLDNTKIVRSLFQDFRSDELFDAVICVGVLEYARAYVTSECPERTMIDLMRSCLRPGGVLIIAIENQLGLKYFSGSLEDHYGSPFFGINDSYRHDAVTTYGRAELSQLIRDSGLPSLEYLAPLPDYKLPVSVVRSDLGTEAPDVVTRLLEQSVSADPQNAPHPTFSLERAWPLVNRNGLLGEFANSFLIVASEKPAIKSTAVAWHYSVDRHPAFAKETKFTPLNDGVAVEYRALSAKAAPAVPLHWQPQATEYFNGVNWWTECVRILNTEGWGVPDLAVWADVWLRALAQDLGLEFGSQLFSASVDGRAFDMIPQNLIVNGAERSFFDAEWSVGADFPFGTVVIRGLRDSIAKITSCAFTATGAPHSVNELVLAILAHLGWLVSKSEFDAMAEFDLRIQSWVRGSESGSIDLSSVGRDWEKVLNVRNPADRDLLSYHLGVSRGEVEEARRKAERDLAENQQTHALALEEVKARADAMLAEVQREALDERDQLVNARQEAAAALEDATRQASLERERLVYEQQRAGAQFEIELAAFEQKLDLERERSARLQSEAEGRYSETEARYEAALVEIQRRAAVEKERALGQLDFLSAQHDHALQEADLALLKSRDESASAVADLLADLEETHLQMTAHREIAAAVPHQARRLKIAEERALRAEALLDRVSAAWSIPNSHASLSEDFSATEEPGGEALYAAQFEAAPADNGPDSISGDGSHCQVAIHSSLHQNAPLEKRKKTMLAKFKKFFFKRARFLGARGRLMDGAIGQRYRAQKDIALIRDAGLVHHHWYLAVYPEAPQDEAAMLEHYFSTGSLEGRGPHPLFDPAWYRALGPHGQDYGTDPLVHYLKQGWRKGMAPHPLFDAGWYEAHNSDVTEAGLNPLIHYLQHGGKEGRNPHPTFDSRWYLEQNPDVAVLDIDPLTHYLEHGGREFRSPHPLFNGVWYAARNPDVVEAGVNPLTHYLQYGWKEGRSPHPLFDPTWYLQHSPDVAEAGVDPLTHYLEHGWREGRAPHPLFDVAAYVEHSPHTANADGGALIDFLRRGWREGRSPHPMFDTAWYMSQRPNLQSSGYQDPLSHYVAMGSKLGLSGNSLIDEVAVRAVSEDESLPALLSFLDIAENQNEFTLNRKPRWSHAQYLSNQNMLAHAADRLNGAA